MQEKKGQKRIFKKNLSHFQSKIVSHVKASPTDFVKVLTNPKFYKNFKFDISSISKETLKNQQDPNLKQK